MAKSTHTHLLRDSGKVSNALDMSANITTETTNVLNVDNIGIVASWNGTSPVGTLFVDVSNDEGTSPTNWATLDFGVSIAIANNTDSGVININQVPFVWLRVRYVRTSGTGTLTLALSMKRNGG